MLIKPDRNTNSRVVKNSTMSAIITLALAYLYKLDEFLVRIIGGTPFTQNLLITPTGKYITEFILVISVLLLTYETIYWTGIHFGLWEYHAKDIFTEIPVHCAHVYVRVNVVKRENEKSMDEYYQVKQKSKYNPLNHNVISAIKEKAFERSDFIKYHFEFSPDDFEMNPEPEYGSTIEHLRNRVLKLFNDSDLYKEFQSDNLTAENIVIYDKNSQKIGKDKDKEYLAKSGIETGDVVDCIILYS